MPEQQIYLQSSSNPDEILMRFLILSLEKETKRKKRGNYDANDFAQSVYTVWDQRVH
jgi:hypothetical protein